MEPSWKKVSKKDPQHKNNQTALGGHVGKDLFQNRILVEICGVHFYTYFSGRFWEASDTIF